MYELKKLTIKKLLHKYDVEINLTPKCQVLIGANGIGKSVSLKILHCILTGNFVDIVAVPFDEIIAEVYGNDLFEKFPGSGIGKTQTEKNKRKKVSFRYTDCFPNKESVTDRFRHAFYLYEDDFYNLLTDLEKRGLYEQFIYCLYKKTEFPFLIKQIAAVYLNEFNEDVVSTADSDSGRDLQHCLQDLNLVSVKDAFPFGDTFLYFDGSSFENTSIFEMVEHNIIRNVFYFDLVQSYQIDNTVFFQSSFTSKDKEWAYSDTDQLKKYPKIKREIDIAKVDPEIFQKTDKLLIECEDNLKKKNTLMLNSLLNGFFYEPEVCIRLNEIAVDHARKYYDSLGSMFRAKEKELYAQQERIENRLKEKSEFFNAYIRPVLVRNSFFDHVIDFTEKTENRIFDAGPEDVDYDEIPFVTDPSEEGYQPSLPETREKEEDSFLELPPFEEDFLPFDDNDPLDMMYYDDGVNYSAIAPRILYHKTLLQFIDAVTPIVLKASNRTKEVRSFQDVIEKYLIDRDVMICPAGFFIRNRVEGEDKKIWNIFDKQNIDLSFLSSGEKKLLLIFTVAIFFEKIILMDEPELSLSLVWQEMLLPDVLRLSRSKIVCATHSPYIVNDESVQKYIRYIP